MNAESALPTHESYCCASLPGQTVSAHTLQEAHVSKKTVDDDPGLCYVSAGGQIVCDGSTEVDTLSANKKAALAKLLGTSVGKNQIDLISALIKAVLEADLDDTCIGTRTIDTVQSVQQVLAASPPVMFLYHYNSLPGVVMAQFYMSLGKFKKADALLKMWGTTKPGC